MANELKTRIQLRHDTEENWTSVKDSFIPLVGEACLTTDGENKGKVKYGDGTSTWGQLEYSGGKDIVEVDSSIVKFDDDLHLPILLVNMLLEEMDLLIFPRLEKHQINYCQMLLRKKKSYYYATFCQYFLQSNESV